MLKCCNLNDGGCFEAVTGLFSEHAGAMLPGTAGAALAAAALPRRRAAPTRRTVLHAQPLAWLHAPVVSSHGTDARQLKANFSGVWVKDRAASDDMGEALALMRVGGLLRQAIKLIRGVEIRQDGASFSMAVFSVLSWFKVCQRQGRVQGAPQCAVLAVQMHCTALCCCAAPPSCCALSAQVTERYALDGSSSKCRRRDFRRGAEWSMLLLSPRSCCAVRVKDSSCSSRVGDLSLLCP
jgi:hypothetical protein